jgi:hypothetical protein
MALTSGRPVLTGFAEALAGPETAESLLAAELPVAAFTRRGARPALRRHPRLVLQEVTAPEHDAAATVGEVRAIAREDWPSKWGTVREVARIRRCERW